MTFVRKMNRILENFFITYVYKIRKFFSIMILIVFIFPQYWMYKFRDASQPDYDLNHKTTLQQNFNSYSAVVSMVPSLVTNLLAARYGHKINIKTRLISTSLVVLVIFIIFTIFVKINTDSCKQHSFISCFLDSKPAN